MLTGCGGSSGSGSDGGGSGSNNAPQFGALPQVSIMGIDGEFIDLSLPEITDADGDEITITWWAHYSDGEAIRLQNNRVQCDTELETLSLWASDGTDTVSLNNAINVTCYLNNNSLTRALIDQYNLSNVISPATLSAAVLNDADADIPLILTGLTIDGVRIGFYNGELPAALEDYNSLPRGQGNPHKVYAVPQVTDASELAGVMDTNDIYPPLLLSDILKTIDTGNADNPRQFISVEYTAKDIAGDIANLTALGEIRILNANQDAASTAMQCEGMDFYPTSADEKLGTYNLSLEDVQSLYTQNGEGVIDCEYVNSNGEFKAPSLELIIKEESAPVITQIQGLEDGYEGSYEVISHVVDADSDLETVTLRYCVDRETECSEVPMEPIGDNSYRAVLNLTYDSNLKDHGLVKSEIVAVDSRGEVGTTRTGLKEVMMWANESTAQTIMNNEFSNNPDLWYVCDDCTRIHDGVSYGPFDVNYADTRNVVQVVVDYIGENDNLVEVDAEQNRYLSARGNGNGLILQPTSKANVENNISNYLL